MAEAAARRKRQGAWDKLKAVADLVTAFVNKNVAALTTKKPSATNFG